MFELKKAICMCLLSAPLVYGVNDLAFSLDSGINPAVFESSFKATHKQAYNQGTNSFHQVGSRARN